LLSTSTEDPRAEHCKPSPSRTSRSYVAVYLILGYAVFAVSSWAIICILNYRPVTTGHYGLYSTSKNRAGYPYGYNSEFPFLGHPIRPLYEKNAQWLQAARVIQSITAVLTIPLTSAVCMRAVVIYVQRRYASGSLTLQQLVELADKVCIAKRIYFKSSIRLKRFLATNKGTRHGRVQTTSRTSCLDGRGITPQVSWASLCFCIFWAS
jgi:hypothetical protein